MFCKYCGNKIVEGQRFCDKCGKQLAVAVSSNDLGSDGDASSTDKPQTEGAPNKPRKPGKRFVLAVCCAIALCIGTVWLAVSFLGKEATVPPSAVPDSTESTSEQAGNDPLDDQASGFAVKDHEAKYQYRARGYGNNPNFEWVIGDDLPDGTVVGSRIADFDGDGENELLSVVWHSSFIDLNMYEAEGGSAVIKAAMGDADTLAFPIKGNGSLDIATDESGAIFIQWWLHTDPAGDGHEWAVVRIDYNGERFNMSDSATVTGTGMRSLDSLKVAMRNLGLSTDNVPDEYTEEFMVSNLVGLDPKLELITRAVAWVDFNAVASSALQEMNHGSSTWSDLKYLGEFRIGPGVAPWNEQGFKSNEQIAENFIRAWYGDWTFGNGKAREVGGTISSRTRSFIAPATDLYVAFQHADEHPSSPTASKYARSFASCVVDCSAKRIDETHVKVDATGTGTQQGLEYITQEMFDRSLANAWSVSYILTFDGNGRIIELEDASVARS